MKRTLTRRQVTTLLAGMALAPALLAQTPWPAKPIRLVVPAGAGSGPDIMARLIGDRLGQRLGQPIVVEPTPGASGILGADKALNAAPDGYTFLFGFNQLMTMNPHIYAKLPYDPVKGIAPVSLISKGGYVLIAGPNVPFDDVAGMIQHARAHPGALTYASFGNGSAPHLGMELLKQRAGIDLLHVPYRTSAAANTDLMANQIQVKIETQTSAVALVRSGKVKALAVTTGERLAALPSVPALKESVPGFELTGWNAVWAPAGVPTAIVDQMSRAIQATLQEPELRKRLGEMGLDPQGSSPSELDQLTRQESAQWGKLIREKGIKAD
ncbi:Bug family tripartite tricarboxylate transporter substrate binding protein [Hydrogenophaga laconesensis]|uniref:Tripartite-type tricarboxylate transporter receptor subunit TctC n=1 Tax=Hydrogenophaga laconesensis TaxID=1805971 RepID=A0ABU1V982_9BURK|nr:tripartite tricarboxylate transporter substrate binding protein [Hydrogenophaga laconesensis]MDR7093990.1 tripartite-type tricarboxylate transporter receptor subunit TctC [Hydrogenophaga laconesensis]